MDVAVVQESAESNDSGSIDWDELEAEWEEVLPTMSPPPKHKPGDDLEWPGTIAAYSASVSAVVILPNDDWP